MQVNDLLTEALKTMSVKDLYNEILDKKEELKLLKQRTKQLNLFLKSAKVKLDKQFFIDELFLPINRLYDYQTSKGQFISLTLIYKVDNEYKTFSVGNLDYIEYDENTGHFEVNPEGKSRRVKPPYHIVFDNEIKKYKLFLQDKCYDTVDFVGFYNVEINDKLVKGTSKEELIKNYILEDK